MKNLPVCWYKKSMSNNKQEDEDKSNTDTEGENQLHERLFEELLDPEEKKD